MKNIYKVVLLVSTIVSGASAGATLPMPTIVGGGSTVQNPLMRDIPTNGALTKLYNASFPCPKITYNEPEAFSGSDAGLNALRDRLIDFAGSDFPPTDEFLKELGATVNTLLTFPIAQAGVSVIHNRGGCATDPLELTSVQVASIYNGDFPEWGDVGCPNVSGNGDPPPAPITVFIRGDGSGTTLLFTTFLNRSQPELWPEIKVGSTPDVFADDGSAGIPSNFVQVSGSDEMLQSVASTPNSIGYVGHETVVTSKCNVREAAIENIDGDFVVPTSESLSQASEGVSPDFGLRTDTIWNTSAPGAYPIANPTNVVVFAEQATEFLACNLKQFIRWVVLNGKSIFAPQGFAPLSSVITESVVNRLELITAPKSCTDTGNPCLGQFPPAKKERPPKKRFPKRGKIFFCKSKCSSCC